VLTPAILPWRYLVPRRGYFRQARASRNYPEIAYHLDLAALCAASWPLTAVAVVVFGIPAVPILLILFLLDYLNKRLDLSDNQQAFMDKVTSLFNAAFIVLLGLFNSVPCFLGLREELLDEARFIHRRLKAQRG